MTDRPYTVCKHCGSRIAYQQVWPSGTMHWVDRSSVVCGAFCPAVEGRDHAPGEFKPEPPTERHYVTGVPICVTVNDETGAVTFDVDLTEIHDVIEHVEGDITPQVEGDIHTVSVAAGRLGNTLTFTLNPAQEAS